ncbi:SidJ-related pseudokinase [uncultured Desulfosarcina sp.]|uniref:SidJ-related pseudokinase n=1 Tax=uncultured Desulfosarcina sp. TaxID=218289 RepID=UPI0029C99F34|nr:SidJ-related pseudokinase [uncultured Desulfosarcina sp.]
MNTFPDTLKIHAEAALNDPHFDFIATYHAVADLRRLARKHPGVLDGQTLFALEQLLQSNTFRSVRQAYFLFREAASVMTDMATAPGHNGLGSKALASLRHLLLKTDGSAHRGVAEALGSLPVSIAGPRIGDRSGTFRPTISWTTLLSSNGLTMTGTPRYIGRSLVVETSEKNHLLVVKLAKKGDTATGLAKEISWMEALKMPDYSVDCRFHIPTPLGVDNPRVFRLKGIPLAPPDTVNRHPDGLAIAFIAHRDYFVYPNHHRVDTLSAREMLGRNAFLLGRLTAKGVIHDAPIALFHNRTQRLRRDDQGRYQWFRSGRLDQWLDSCAFPNLGLSGLRDFEHLESFCGDSRLLYRHIGSHFLSLLLVAGSHFRGRDKSKVGLDDNGQPVDARDLFDRPLLKSMVMEIFENYYFGFTGKSANGSLPVDLDGLTGRMIAEMGVDRYMTELLRRTDQNALTDGEFVAFLKERGYSADQLDGLTRGEEDILINSGPHLGGFNRQISLPELIEAVAAMSAVCIAGRFIETVKNRT